MRTVKTKDIISEVSRLCIEAAYYLGEDVKEALRKSLEKEKAPLGKDVLREIIKNFEIAEREHVPMCQDTGTTIVFVDVGRDVYIDGPLEDAINEGVRAGYKKGYLRMSVCDPISRTNTGDNTPAVIHTSIVEGDKLTIGVVTKGSGSENMSRMKMLKPSDGIEGIRDFIIEAVTKGGGMPCPPIVIGVGIGGDFEMAPILAKRSLFRKVGSANTDKELDKLEHELLETINKLGVGPMGFGGLITALAINISKQPCHIASLPVAINIQCHADRHKVAVL